MQPLLVSRRHSELTLLSLVYAVPIPIAITQPVVWIVRPEAQARPTNQLVAGSISTHVTDTFGGTLYATWVPKPKFPWPNIHVL